MKFLEQTLFCVSLNIPARGGMPADVSDICQVLHQGEGTLMEENENTQRVDGWAVHIIPPGERDGDMVELTEDTSEEVLSTYLMALPEGAVAVTSLVLEDYASTKAYRRTVDGFVLVMRTSTDATEGFSLEVF